MTKIINLFGVSHHNFILERHKPFDTRGRFEDEDTAKRFDVHVKKMLDTWGISYTTVAAEDRARAQFIIEELKRAA